MMDTDDGGLPPVHATMAMPVPVLSADIDSICADAENGWGLRLQQLREALGSGDVSIMVRAWHAACLEALASQHWGPLISVGRAAVCMGLAIGLPAAFAAKARQAFDIALYRARKASSVEGVLRVAAGFAALGDREALEQSVALAERLTLNAEVGRHYGRDQDVP